MQMSTLTGSTPNWNGSDTLGRGHVTNDITHAKAATTSSINRNENWNGLPFSLILRRITKATLLFSTPPSLYRHGKARSISMTRWLPQYIRQNQRGTGATQQEEGIYRYLTHYYAATHGLGIWSLAIITSLVAMPVLSLLKPVLEFKGLATVLAAVAGLAGLAALVFVIKRTLGYYLAHERCVPNGAHSWSSIIAYGGMTALIPLCLLVAVEYFSPRSGILATLVPSFKEQQTRWLASAENERKPDRIEADHGKDQAIGEQQSIGNSAVADARSGTPGPDENATASARPNGRVKRTEAQSEVTDSPTAGKRSSGRSDSAASPSEEVIAEGLSSPASCWCSLTGRPKSLATATRYWLWRSGCAWRDQPD